MLYDRSALGFEHVVSFRLPLGQGNVDLIQETVLLQSLTSAI